MPRRRPHIPARYLDAEKFKPQWLVAKVEDNYDTNTFGELSNVPQKYAHTFKIRLNSDLTKRFRTGRWRGIKYVVAWAAARGRDDEKKDPKQAYGKYKNIAVGKLNTAKTKFKVRLAMPRKYGGYERHLHFVAAIKSSNGKWNWDWDNVQTMKIRKSSAAAVEKKTPKAREKQKQKTRKAHRKAQEKTRISKPREKPRSLKKPQTRALTPWEREDIGYNDGVEGLAPNEKWWWEKDSAYMKGFRRGEQRRRRRSSLEREREAAKTVKKEAEKAAEKKAKEAAVAAEKEAAVAAEKKAKEAADAAAKEAADPPPEQPAAAAPQEQKTH